MAYIKQSLSTRRMVWCLSSIQADLASKGYIPNYVQAFSLHPEIYDAWLKLIGAVRSKMRLRRYELITFSAAMALGCTY